MPKLSSSWPDPDYKSLSSTHRSMETSPKCQKVQRSTRLRCKLFIEPWVASDLTPPSSGRPPASFACFRPPLMSNVRRHSRSAQVLARMYKNHASFPKAKHTQRYLFPHACFACRKVFRKPFIAQGRICPQCAGALVTLGRKFHAPKSTNSAQWRKVQLLVEHGFFFDSVYRATESGGNVAVPYPRTLAEVPAFVAEFKSQARRPLPSRAAQLKR